MSRHWNVLADFLLGSELMRSQGRRHLTAGASYVERGGSPNGARAYLAFMGGSTQNLTNSPTSLMSLVSVSLPSAFGTSHCHFASASSILGTGLRSFSS